MTHILVKLDDYHAKEINRRRKDFEYARMNDPANTGFIGHVGNQVISGDIYPALIVRRWTENSANAQVFLDGNDVYWATSIAPNNDSAGTWGWDHLTPPKGDEPAPEQPQLIELAWWKDGATRLALCRIGRALQVYSNGSLMLSYTEPE